MVIMNHNFAWLCVYFVHALSTIYGCVCVCVYKYDFESTI